MKRRSRGVSALFIRGFLVFGFLAPGGSSAQPEMPATMLLTGRIEASFFDAMKQPTEGDAVLAFSVRDGQLVGIGAVGKRGNYLLAATRSASFNGTPIVLELQKGRYRYALLEDSGRVAALAFAGRLLPERTVIALQVGKQTAELKDAELANPQAQRLSRYPELPCDALSDVNEDGVCDEKDWEILRRYAGGVSRSVAHP